MTFMYFTCPCGMIRGMKDIFPYFRKFSLGPCMRCGAPFEGRRIPFLGVWRTR